MTVEETLPFADWLRLREPPTRRPVPRTWWTPSAPG